MKILTVVVPCYNSQDYMRKCIQSLLPGKERLEIIIVDDGSYDKTGLIADEYSSRYPSLIRVIHQENSGHGEGINKALKIARGLYFKVVDSDDCLSGEFPFFLEKLEECEAYGGADLVVTNYRYVHKDGIGDRSIDYSNALPKGQIIGWPKTRRFHIHQLLSIHSCTFRTKLMQKSGVVLPKHTSYEDEYMIHGNLRYVKRLYYLDMDLYRYTIGRKGQSVQKNVMRKKYGDQIEVTRLCFESFPLSAVKEPYLKRYLKHELFILFGMAAAFARMNQSEEADRNLSQMWKDCEKFDHKNARKLWLSPLLLMNIPGKMGREISMLIFHLAHRIVPFN